MASSSSGPPYYGVDTSVQSAGSHASRRRSGQSARQGRTKPDKWDDLNEDVRNPSEGTAEQGGKTRHDTVLLSDPSDDASKESKGGTALINVLYRIDCQDNKNKRAGGYSIPENPFEEFILQDLEKQQTRMVIEVFINANGVGSPLEWAPYGINPFASGKAPIYDMEEDIDIRAGEVPRYPRSPPPRRVVNYSDFNSEVSDDNDEDFLEDERFEGPTRNSTLRADGRAPMSLQEVLDKGIFRASVVSWTEIHIHSRNLQRLLRTVVQRYPGQSLKGEKIVVRAPFDMLAHYYNDLNALQNGASDVLAKARRDASNDTEQLEVPENTDLLDGATIYDLKVLLRAFKLHYAKNLAPEEARYNVGVTSFGLLWFLFKPGVDVYARIGGKFSGFVFERCEKRGGMGDRARYDERIKPAESGHVYYVAHCWNLTYNGHRIVKTWHEFYIDKFRGERQITSLQVFPCIYLDHSDGGKTRARLQDLGEKYYNIIRQSPAHKVYCGMTWDLEREDPRDETERWQKGKPDIVNTIYWPI
jgi:hypothetical protein